MLCARKIEVCRLSVALFMHVSIVLLCALLVAGRNYVEERRNVVLLAGCVEGGKRESCGHVYAWEKIGPCISVGIT